MTIEQSVHCLINYKQLRAAVGPALWSAEQRLQSGPKGIREYVVVIASGEALRADVQPGEGQGAQLVFQQFEVAEHGRRVIGAGGEKQPRRQGGASALERLR